MIVVDSKIDDMRVGALQERMFNFYRSTKSYNAFESDPDQSWIHAGLTPLIRTLLQNKNNIRILEIGSGRSVFHETVKIFGTAVEYHAQDITAKNENTLKERADYVHIGELSRIKDIKFDLIFSTYVWEHIAFPRNFLEKVDDLLLSGGYHVIVSPRYDFPGYLCPSLRYGYRKKQIITKFKHTLRCLQRACGHSRYMFCINTEPAVLHVPWFRDADAIHIVSQHDSDRWHKEHGYRVQQLDVCRSWIHSRITLARAYQKQDSIFI